MTVIITSQFIIDLDNKFFTSIKTDDIILYRLNYSVSDGMVDNIILTFPNCDYIFILDDTLFKHISTNPLALYNSRNTIENFDNFLKYFEKLPINTKYIYLDNIAESTFPLTSDLLIKWLNLSNFNYIISSRFRNIIHPHAIVGLSYLPILYMFLRLNFKKFPMLDYSKPSHPKYDFITYLGQSYKSQNRINRYEILKQIFDNDLTNIKYEDNNNFEIAESEFGESKPGHYWNILNSLSAKIQIIFETYPFYSKFEGASINKIDIDEHFFSEKIMKCFILPHPYLLIIHKKWLNSLENYGFKFNESNKCETINEFKHIIKNIKSNIDGWIEENRLYYEHNQHNLYELGNSITLPHHEFLKNIITN
jgi:hypothetical protein